MDSVEGGVSGIWGQPEMSEYAGKSSWCRDARRQSVVAQLARQDIDMAQAPHAQVSSR